MSIKPYPDSSNQTPNNVNSFTIPGLMETPHRNEKFLIFPGIDCKVRVPLYKREESSEDISFRIRTKQQAAPTTQEHNVCLSTAPLHVDKETKDGHDVYYMVADIQALGWVPATWYVYVDIKDADAEYREKFGILISADAYSAYPHIGSANDSEFVLVRPRRSSEHF